MKNKILIYLMLITILSSLVLATNLEDNIIIKEKNQEYKVKGPLNVATYSINIGSITENPFLYLYSKNSHFSLGIDQLGKTENFKIVSGYENFNANHFVMDTLGNINMSENVNIGKNLFIQGTPIQKQIQPTICEYGIKYIDQSGAITCVGEANLNIPENYTYTQTETNTTLEEIPNQTTNYNENGDLVFQAGSSGDIIFVIG